MQKVPNPRVGRSGKKPASTTERPETAAGTTACQGRKGGLRLVVQGSNLVGNRMPFLDREIRPANDNRML